MRTITVTYLLLLAFLQFTTAQVITTDPEFPTDKQAVTIRFDASKGSGGLAGYTGDVYAHIGLITEESTGDSDWKYVVSDWGVNIDKIKLTRIETDIYELEITPDIRSYYSAPESEELLKMAFVFRNADGSITGKGDGDSDIYYEIYKDELSVKFITPENNAIYELNDDMDFSVSSSDTADITISINGQNYLTANNTIKVSDTYTLDEKKDYWFKATAVTTEETIIDSIFVLVKEDVPTGALPTGVQKGANYDTDTSATFVLWAPDKEFVYLIGDFNDWHPYNSYQMNKDGDYFWLTLDNLKAGEQYVYQYYIDGEIKIADPYTEQVSDPAHDKFIDEETYPGLIAYPTGKTEGIAAVYSTTPEEYTWEVTNFTPVDNEKLVVYECLVRDFTEDHTYAALIEKLDYLETLGVTALELMPVNEFEGNESWGYNPSFYFAADKYYGPKNELKRLVDECHKRGIAVIIDIVLNHSFSQSPFAQMYLDGGKPAVNNPWYNREHNMVDNTASHWGYDFNHESEHTKELIDSINSYWLNEYKADGFRFDFTKGFTNTIYTGENNWASAYDASRITNLKRMSDEIWKRNPNAFVIFEHLSDNSEEKELANYGILLWGNINHNYAENAMAWHESNKSDLSWGYYESRGWNEANLVSYAESHDEERVMFKSVNYGNSAGSYNIQDTATALTRVAANAAFHIPIPGPKMLWQFQEVGYDYSIDYNGRVGNKPVRWDYFEDANRKSLYNQIASINMLKTTYEEFYAPDNFIHDLDNGAIKSMTLSNGSNHVVIVGNFDVTEQDVTITFPETGTYYDYFGQSTIEVSNTQTTITMAPGAYKIYSTRQFESPLAIPSAEAGMESVVFPNPANNYISFTLENIANVEIFNSTGQLVMSEQVSSNTVSIEALKSGFYFVKLTDTENNNINNTFLKL